MTEKKTMFSCIITSRQRFVVGNFYCVKTMARDVAMSYIIHRYAQFLPAVRQVCIAQQVAEANKMLL